jgi:phage baseplate assembly protein W
MTTYKGFSTYNRYKKFRVTDEELIKQNLFNHFNTRQGEKLMQPNFGSLVWNMMFEPLTEETKGIIVEDIKRIVGYDPRIRTNNIVITQFDHGIQVELEIEFVLTNRLDTLRLSFDNNSQQLTRG